MDVRLLLFMFFIHICKKTSIPLPQIKMQFMIFLIIFTHSFFLNVSNKTTVQYK